MDRLTINQLWLHSTNKKFSYFNKISGVPEQMDADLSSLVKLFRLEEEKNAPFCRAIMRVDRGGPSRMLGRMGWGTSRVLK